MLVVSKITRPLGWLFALLTVSLFSVTLVSSTAHAGIENWNAGKIMDDVVFTNNSSMNVGQIQEFLNSKVPTCDTYGTSPSEFGGGTRAQWAAARGYSPPFTCLKDFTENGKSSAQIIYDAAQEFTINPQVLIVLLQKEQSLITDTWPIPGSSQYRSATGYGCPDTAPCDSQYYGLTNQIRWSARMFRAIINASPTWYTPYVLGNNYIRYSPTASCGGSTVNIQNRATQALYNYTPYQPNAGALAAGWGTAPCGAYGNRNFYLYFTNWFGPTTRSLVTATGGGVYLIENNTKRAFPDEISFISNNYRWSDIVTVSVAELANIPSGAPVSYNTHYRDGKLVNSAGGMFIIENGLKRPFPNEAIYISYGYGWNDALVISPSESALIPYGQPLPYNTRLREGRLVTAPGVGVYLIENGLKRPFTSAEAFNSWSYRWSDILTISASELPYFQDGQPVFYNTHYRDGKLVNSAGGMFIIENGLKRPFPNEAIYISYGYGWNDALVISPSESALIPYGQPLPYNTRLREGRLVTAPGVGVYLIENGLKRPFPNEATFLSYGYKWSDVLSISAQEMSIIPNGNMMTTP